MGTVGPVRWRDDLDVGKKNLTNITDMGDKSPKATQKKSSQKQAATSSADQKKKQAAAAKASPAKKK